MQCVRHSCESTPPTACRHRLVCAAVTFLAMAKAKRDKAPKDTRKPKHSNDSNRANKESKAGFRDASTASHS
jgi:hypothetical protein